MVSTLVYVGLAVLGWGGFVGFFSHPALTALAIAVFVMAGVGLFSSGNLTPACARIVPTDGSLYPLR